MAGRGTTRKISATQRIVLERGMVTRHYVMTWDLNRCIGCQIGPLVCPKDAVIHLAGHISDGRLLSRPTIDIDADRCVLCGMCEVMCPKNAITLTINDRPENPSLVYGAFPNLIQSTIFEGDAFDWSRKDFVIANCPTEVIRYHETRDTLVVDDEHCIRCRQCEIASDGAFRVVQPWQGKAELRRDKCVEGCLACADICPTRALHIDGEGELALADYYCIKCGACMQVCPIQPEYEEYQEPIDSQGVHKVVVRRRIVNVNDLAVWVERWRVRHTPVQSAAWISALTHMADGKASVVEIDRARALRRRDLLRALVEGNALLNKE